MKTHMCSSLSQFILPVKRYTHKHRERVACKPRMIALYSSQGCQIVALRFIILYFLLSFRVFSFLPFLPFIYQDLTFLPISVHRVCR